MRYGVVSDIHANIQAWKAVLRDMKNQGVDVILCLGDVVGYGPNPAEVLDSCYEHVDYFILGNHDAVVGNRLDSSLFNDNAKYLIDWTKDQLNPAACDFFSDMPLRMEGDGFVCAHGELAMPGRFGYIYEAQDAIESFTSNQSPMMFVGHTHFPAKFVLDTSNNSVRKDNPTDSFLLPHERYLINAGSVGDPRDGNVTASYCIYDTDASMIKFRQVPFDIEKFRQNLKAVKLPVNPFFIRVYDGQQSEMETIKDMKVMESNQTTEATGNSQRIIRVGEDVKTRRKKLNFSMDDLRSTRHLKMQEASRREAETQAKKKGKTVVIGLLVALLVVFGIVIGVVKSGQSDDQVASSVVNPPPESAKKKVDTVIQEDGKDLVLSASRADLPVDSVLDETSGVLMGWTKHTTQLKWNARIKHKGWYEVFIDHAKKDADSEVRLKFSNGDSFDVHLKATAEGKLEKKSLGYFETTGTGEMWVYLIALKPGPESVTGLKSVSLRFHGDQKPNPFGDLPDLVFEDFTEPYFNNEWIIKGDAFPHRPLSKETISPFTPVKGVNGDYCAGSMNDAMDTKDDLIQAQGSMISRKFIIKHRYIHMLARGGDNVSVAVSVKGRDVKTKKPPHNWPIQLLPIEIDLTDYIGEEARLIFRDKGDRNIVFDNIVFSNKALNSFGAGSTELKKEIPAVTENEGDLSLVDAGKHFVKGDIEKTIEALAAGSSSTGTEVVNSSLYKNEILKFSELKMASNNTPRQLESGNVTANNCRDKDSYNLQGTFATTHDLRYVQLDAIADKGRSVGFTSNGNIFLSGYSLSVTRKELMNKGKYIRISLSGDKVLSLAEVQVFSGDKNVSQGKAASQSSTSNDAPASRAVDGNTSGVFTNNSVTHTAGGRNPWWEVDLGEVTAIDKIIVFNRTDKDPGTLMARLNRYSISILDENRKIIWQDFIKEAKEKHEHRVSETFTVSFDFAKSTYSDKGNTPSKCIHSNDAQAGWSIYAKRKETQKAWFGLNLPLLINEGDSFKTSLHFNSNHKKHVMRKFRLTVLSEDNEKLEEERARFKPFLNYKEAILETFKGDIGKGQIDLIAKGGKSYKVSILAVKDDGRIFITKTRSITFEVLGEAELEKRTLAMPNGQVIWAYRKGELAEKINELEYDSETFVGKLIDAGIKVFVAKHDPMILTGRYIEIWKQENEKKPEFDVIVNSSGQTLTMTPEVAKFKDLYPDYPGGNFDISVVDLGVDRNINFLKIKKKTDGKISKFSLVIKNEAKDIIWQKSWYLKNILDNNGMGFELKGGQREKKEENLAKDANLLNGTITGSWKGLTDGFIGEINPFAFSIDGSAPQDLILDLGEEKTVNAFRAFKSTTSAFNGIQIEYSTDNENYTPLAAVGTENLSQSVVLWTMPEKAVRYVKIKFINNHSNYKHHWFKDKCILSEFQVLKF